MPYIGKTPTVGNFQVCDAISVVNGQAAYTLQVGGVNVAPESANHMLVSLNGILQKPGSSFTVSGSTMTFASNLATGDVIDFVQILGNVLDLGQPSDDTVGAAQIKNDLISGTTALTSAPDDTDEFLVSDAGTLKRIDYSLIKGGKVLQVVTATDSTQRTTTSTSYVTASNTLTANITPSATSSKVLIMLSTTGFNAGNKYTYYTIYRDSSNVASNSSQNELSAVYGDNGVNIVPLHISHLDSPNTTSQVTYQAYMKVQANTGYFNVNGNTGSIILMEIGA